MPLVIVVDSVIGGGKTTLLTTLQESLSSRGLRVTTVPEPVEKWKASGMLKLFYEDPRRWGYTFQTKAFHDRVVENVNAFEASGYDTDVFILERSPFTDPLFVEILNDDGLLTPLEYDTYQDWWKMWAKVMPYEPDVFVYLRPTLDECMRRTRNRNRPGEEGISREYQEKLMAKHDAFFSSTSVSVGTRRVPCITLHTDANFRDDGEIKQKIASFFEFLISTPGLEPEGYQAEFDRLGLV